ncbi:hypothetical protein [Salana multivorans]
MDALRGCLAVERGPLLYCVEQADLPVDVAVDDLVLVPGAAPEVADDASLSLACAVLPPEQALYPAGDEVPGAVRRVSVRAVPFATWGNRASGAMKVWLPVGGDPGDPARQAIP